jgi:hypothetical protein
LTQVAQPNQLPWLNTLPSRQIAALLANLTGYQPTSLVDAVRNRSPTGQTYFVEDAEADDEPRWKLEPAVLEELQRQRRQLDIWWAERTHDVQSALRRHRHGFVPGRYRDDVEKSDLVGPLDDGGLDSRFPFALPKLILGYVMMTDGS